MNRAGGGNAGCVALFGLPFLLVGVGMAVWSVSDVDDVLGAREWRAVPAELDHVELSVHHDSDGANTYRAVARYHYEVDGRRYEGDRVSFHGGADNIGGYQKNMEGRLRRAWSRGEPVTVYVNPARPGESVIDRSLRVEIVLFRLVFVVVFGGAGLAMVMSVLRRRRRADETAAAAARHPNAPWRARPEWETGEIRASSRPMWMALLFAAVWNLISWPAFIAASDALRGGLSLVWLVLVFPVIGVGLLYWAASHVAQRLRFGVSTLKLSTWPPRVGNTVAGEIDTRAKGRGGERFKVRVARRERVASRSSSNTQAVNWVERFAQEVELPVGRALRGPSGWRLPFSFELPSDEPPTDFAGGEQAWWIEARAGRGFGHYRADFEVPVVSLTTLVPDAENPVPDDGHTCPRELTVTLRDPTGPWQEEACGSCGGQLLPGDGAEELLRRQGLELPTLKRLVDEMGTPSLNCPHCRTRMAQVQVRGQWIDLCGGCGALWLDDGELAALDPGAAADGRVT